MNAQVIQLRHGLVGKVLYRAFERRRECAKLSSGSCATRQGAEVGEEEYMARSETNTRAATLRASSIKT